MAFVGILTVVRISVRPKRWFMGLLSAAALLIAVAHLGLLWQRIGDATLLQPLVLARWLGALALVAALLVLKRYRGSVFAGRPAVALWSLVLLLHLLAGVPAADAVEVDLLLPIGLIAASLWIVTVLLGSRPADLCPRTPSLVDSPRAIPVRLTGFVCPVGLRGPPLF